MINVNKRLHIYVFFTLIAASLLLVSLAFAFGEERSIKESEYSVSLLSNRGEQGSDADERIDGVLDMFESITGQKRADVSAIGIDSVIKEALSFLEEGRGELFALALYVFGIGGLMVFAELAISGGAIGYGAEAVGCAALFARVYPHLEEAVSALGEINTLFSSLTPVFASLIALGGYGATAAAESVTMGTTLWLYGGFGSNVLLAVSVGMLLFGFISSVGEGFTGLGRGFSAAFTKGMGFLTAAFAAITSLQTFVTGALDSAALRTAKYAAQTLIPVVGSSVSGAMSTLSGGLSYAAGIMGGGTVAAILSVGLAPLAVLLFLRLLFFLLGSFAEYSSAKGVSTAVSGFSSGLDALISVYTLSAAIYTLESILFLKTVLSA